MDDLIIISFYAYFITCLQWLDMYHEQLMISRMYVCIAPLIMWGISCTFKHTKLFLVGWFVVVLQIPIIFNIFIIFYIGYDIQKLAQMIEEVFRMVITCSMIVYLTYTSFVFPYIGLLFFTTFILSQYKEVERNS